MWVALRLDSESVALLLVFRGRREGSPHAPDGSAQLCPALPGAGAARPGQPSPREGGHEAGPDLHLVTGGRKLMGTGPAQLCPVRGAAA